MHRRQFWTAYALHCPGAVASAVRCCMAASVNEASKSSTTGAQNVKNDWRARTINKYQGTARYWLELPRLVHGRLWVVPDVVCRAAPPFPPALRGVGFTRQIPTRQPPSPSSRRTAVHVESSARLDPPTDIAPKSASLPFVLQGANQTIKSQGEDTASI
eukprot:354762-Chlamydomonas_euryale.AAC.7